MKYIKWLIKCRCLGTGFYICWIFIFLPLKSELKPATLMAATCIPEAYKFIVDRADCSEAWNICGIMRDKNRTQLPPSPWRRKGRRAALVFHVSLQGSCPPTSRTFPTTWKEIKSCIKWRISPSPCFSESVMRMLMIPNTEIWGEQTKGGSFRAECFMRYTTENWTNWSQLVVVPLRLIQCPWWKNK